MSANQGKGYDVRDELKRIIVGIIFVAGMPAFLIFATDVDILQGCLVYSDVEIERDVDGAEEGKCKEFSTGGGPLTEIIENVQFYVPLGISLFILAFGVALLLGPGIKVIKYQFDK